MIHSQLIFKIVKYKTGYNNDETADYFISNTYESLQLCRSDGEIVWVDLEAINENILHHYTEHYSVRISDLIKYNNELNK